MQEKNIANWIVVGLGNPGDRYKNTRHNVGRMAVEMFQGTPGTFDGDVQVVVPDTYMNLSGGPVAKAMQKSPESRLIIVHDDIDIPFGDVKVSVGKGSGGQKGVEDIIKALKTKDFVRVRIGITPVFFGKERRPRGAAVARFVLKRFGITERGKLSEVLERASDVISTIVKSGPQIAMNRFN